MRKQWFLAAIPALVLWSCSGSKVLPAESLHMDAATTRDYPSRFYDDHTQIRYDFRNDDQYLYVILETDNPAARMRILREGVKIYFPPSASKSETRLVEYPFHPDREKAPVDLHHTAGTGTTRPPETGMPRADERDYTSFYKQARVTSNGKIALVDAAAAAPGALHFKAANDADGFFRYIVSIPKSQLSVNKGHTVVGIRIPEMKGARGTYSGHGGASTHMSAGGGGRGGMHGGGGGGMRGKGGMNGGGMHNRGGETDTPNHSKQDVSGKVDWWYKIGLAS